MSSPFSSSASPRLCGSTLDEIAGEIEACRACERLVAWREAVALSPPARFRGERYHARPVPGWGDPNARLLVVGLAPAAHGANRTGRVFTGDRSGEWLYRALFRAGFANQETSAHRDDGLQLRDCYVTGALRCAPPANTPTPEELRTCAPYLWRELTALSRWRVVVGLGKVGFDAAFAALRAARTVQLSRAKFGHGAEVEVAPSRWLLGTYHPSQQNTFTRRLTEPMLDEVFARARELCGERESVSMF